MYDPLALERQRVEQGRLRKAADTADRRSTRTRGRARTAKHRAGIAASM